MCINRLYTSGEVWTHMPLPHWRQDEVSSSHLYPPSLYCSEPSVTFNDETDCKSDMAMCRSGLSRQDKLETSVQSVGGVGCLCSDTLATSKAWVPEHLPRLGLMSIRTLLSACSSGTN